MTEPRARAADANDPDVTNLDASADATHTGATGEPESFNPWSVVNLVFHHLAAQGLHPVLGSTGDPGVPAAALLVALGIEPAAEGNRQLRRNVHAELASIREAVFGES
jgi:hypothetical protein